MIRRSGFFDAFVMVVASPEPLICSCPAIIASWPTPPCSNWSMETLRPYFRKMPCWSPTKKQA
jgi:hypothetical protein